MIEITKLNNAKVVINAELIELVESTPDTMITLTTGKKFIAREAVGDIVDRVVGYKRSIHSKDILTKKEND